MHAYSPLAGRYRTLESDILFKHALRTETLELRRAADRYYAAGLTTDMSPAVRAAAIHWVPRGDASRALAGVSAFARWFAKHPKPRPALSILQSRLAPASEILGTHLLSCGSLATLSASLLRAQGYGVRLVHGTYRGSDHAWIELWHELPERWQAFDPTDSRLRNSVQKRAPTTATMCRLGRHRAFTRRHSPTHEQLAH